MVCKIGGYMFIPELVRVWFQKIAVEHAHLGNTYFCTALRKWFAERGMDDVVASPAGYPVRGRDRGREHAIIMRRET